MKKCGFTLAEVLITLGIVGVIAALTMPLLASSSRNQANAAKLSSTVSALENAFTTAIASDAVTDIFDTDLWASASDAADFADKFTNYLQSSLYEGEDFYSGKTIKKLDRSAADTPSGTIFITKSGAVVFISDISTEINDSSEEDEALGALQSPAATVTIDVNGAEMPNTYGRDIFFYKLGENGHLYPYGGKDVSLALDNNSNNVWDSEDSSYACISGSNGRGCAARLAEEGYKMNY